MTAGVRSSAISHASGKREREKKKVCFNICMGENLWGEIDHKDIIKHWLQERNKSLVVRVREVKGSSLFTFKTYHKAMSEFLI